MKSYRAPNLILRIALISIIVAQCGAPSFAATAAAHQSGARPAQPASLNYFPVFGDFDGDQRMDEAEVHLAGAHRCIRVRFSDSHETHLELRATPQASGALLARDVNRDNKPDLIWVYRFQSEPAEAWLSDGSGQFAKADDNTSDDGLRSILFGDSSPALIAGPKEGRSFLTPDPLSTDLAHPAHLSDRIPNAVSILWGGDHRALGLCLSYLRERGPPLHSCFA